MSIEQPPEDARTVRRKEAAAYLRDLANQMESGTVEGYAIAYRGRCDLPGCPEWHLGQAVQTTSSSAELDVWIVGAIQMLLDMVLDDYKRRLAAAQMRPIVDAIKQAHVEAHAQSEAKGATKQ